MTNDLAKSRQRAWELVTAYRTLFERGTPDARRAYADAINRATGRRNDAGEVPSVGEWLDEEHLTADRVADHLARIAESAISCLAVAKRITYKEATAEVEDMVGARERTETVRADDRGGDA